MEIEDNPIKITTTLKVVITGEFYDDEASEETLRYWVEQDLEDDGFDVDVKLLKKQEPKPMIEVEDDDLYAWSPKDVSYYCPRPECGKEISYDYNFCPYCGQAVKLDD